jgi:hypothetical protein
MFTREADSSSFAPSRHLVPYSACSKELSTTSLHCGSYASLGRIAIVDSRCEYSTSCIGIPCSFLIALPSNSSTTSAGNRLRNREMLEKELRLRNIGEAQFGVQKSYMKRRSFGTIPTCSRTGTNWMTAVEDGVSPSKSFRICCNERLMRSGRNLLMHNALLDSYWTSETRAFGRAADGIKSTGNPFKRMMPALVILLLQDASSSRLEIAPRLRACHSRDHLRVFGTISAVDLLLACRSRKYYWTHERQRDTALALELDAAGEGIVGFGQEDDRVGLRGDDRIDHPASRCEAIDAQDDSQRIGITAGHFD